MNSTGRCSFVNFEFAVKKYSLKSWNLTNEFYYSQKTCLETLHINLVSYSVWKVLSPPGGDSM